MLPQIFGLIREIFGPAEMGRALGVLGPVMGLAAILGPIVAGALIGADVLGTGWRMIFLVNVPVAIAALAVGARTLPAGARSAGVRLDARGAVLAAVGMGLLVYPLVQGRELGWPAWVLGLLAASVPVLGLFAAGQVRRRRAGGSPLVEPSVFTHRSFVAGIAFALVFLGSMGGVVLIVGVFLQAGLGYTPIHAALTSAPWALGAFLGSGAASAVMQRLGRRVLHIGLAVMGGGLAWLAVVLAQQGTAVGSWDFAAPLLVSGLGMGAIWVPLFDIVLGGVADHEMGSASGVLQAVQQLGMSLGVAVIGTLFFGLLGRHAGHVADFVAAARITLLVTTALIALAFVVAFGLPRHAKGHEPSGGGAAVPEPAAA
jgi:MFS family permease